MSGDDDSEYLRLRQDVAPHGDAYVAAGNIYINQPPPSALRSRPRRSAPQRRPRIWGNVPARNPAFIGRRELLRGIRAGLAADDRVAVQALNGMGGVGKTQIAIEYAHRHHLSYDVVWWFNAENAALLGEQFAVLAIELGCAALETPLSIMRQAVFRTLRGRQSWLLVFDNAESPEHLAGWIPDGRGHMLITSRARGWDEVAVPLYVGTLDRADSIDILRNRVPDLSRDDADKVAEATGDLPLAAVQAASYMAQTGMPAEEYTTVLGERAAEVLDCGRPPFYPQSLAAVTCIALDHLQAHNEAAADLAAICAFLAPEPIPAHWLTTASALSPGLLGERTADPLAWRQMLADLGRSALASVGADGLVMHRLTQAIIRTRRPQAETAEIRALAEAVVIANDPGDPVLPDSWPAWARMLPHLLILRPEASGNRRLRDLVVKAAWYPARRGDAMASYDIARQLYEQWHERLGADDEHTLLAAQAFSAAMRNTGRYAAARKLNEDTYARSRARLGDDHPRTIAAASSLAVSLYELGEYETARRLDEDTFTRRTALFGSDDPETLRSANAFAADLRALGEYLAARELDRDTLERRRRVLGDDHPHTLTSASNLASSLYALREYQEARELDRDTLERRRRLLGADHPGTLYTANNLAGSRHMLREYLEARELYEDTLARRRRVLGADHPDTLTSASNLAVALRALGEYLAARELDRDTLERRRRVLGDDHPDTQCSGANLALDQHAMTENLNARNRRWYATGRMPAEPSLGKRDGGGFGSS